jgi:polar amino acid transport system substrate-binding protein
MNRRAVGVTAGLLAVAAVVAIVVNVTQPSDAALDVTLSALRATAPKTPDPLTKSVHCTHKTASLRPPARMPAPGHMPQGTFLARIQRRGRLVVGVNQNYLLFAYLNPRQGRIEGFEIDVADEIAKSIFGSSRGRVEEKALTADQRIPYVQQGIVDLAVDNVTITCTRKTQVAFSTVYYNAHQRLLVRSSSHVRSLGDLRGKPVCASNHTVPLEVLEKSPAHVIPYPAVSATSCLVALQEGWVDAISTDDAILIGLHQQDPYTKIVGPAIAAAPYGIAISKDHPELVRFVNGVLARMRSDGTWRRLTRKWLGAETPKAPPTATYSH